MAKSGSLDITIGPQSIGKQEIIIMYSIENHSIEQARS
jgi:hypothetical protein